MTINFNQLAPIQGSQVIAELPEEQSSGGGLGGLLSGIGKIAKGFSAPSAPVESPTPTPVQMAELPKGNNFGFQQGVHESSIFKNALNQVGLKESNPTLSAYLQKANPGLNPTTTPWCAGFVGSVLNASGMKGTGSLMAKSYLNYGTETNNPSQGDLVVLNRTNDPKLGHVGFVQSIDQEKGIVNVLGGNQDNSVSVKSFPLSQVAGFRVAPTGEQVAGFAQQRGIQNPKQLADITKTNGNMNNKTLDLIKGFEGYYSKPYWDVNAHRAGYGSDTTTLPDGTVKRILPGMTVTREDSERDLARRAQEFENTAIKQVGADNWNKLSQNSRSALTSIAYNYGSLPKRIIPAVMSGDPETIAKAVRGLGTDNKGINKGRRNKEASLILQPDNMELTAEQTFKQQGNIDLNSLPKIINRDGTYSTVQTITAEIDGKTILLPTIVNGKRVSNTEAIDHYRKTGKNLGIFNSEDDAEQYDQEMHKHMGWVLNSYSPVVPPQVRQQSPAQQPAPNRNSQSNIPVNLRTNSAFLNPATLSGGVNWNNLQPIMRQE